MTGDNPYIRMRANGNGSCLNTTDNPNYAELVKLAKERSVEWCAELHRKDMERDTAYAESLIMSLAYRRIVLKDYTCHHDYALQRTLTDYGLCKLTLDVIRVLREHDFKNCTIELNENYSVWNWHDNKHQIKYLCEFLNLNGLCRFTWKHQNGFGRWFYGYGKTFTIDVQDLDAVSVLDAFDDSYHRYKADN